MVTSTAAPHEILISPRTAGTAGGTANTYRRGIDMSESSEPFRWIELTKGKRAKVSHEDFEALSAWSWSASESHGRKSVALRGVARGDGRSTMTMHRQIMGLTAFDGLEVDHINHDTLDNRRTNLRVVSPGANKRWQPARGGSSNFVGVTWDSNRGKWRAQIQVDGRVKNLGRFDSEIAAAAARDQYVKANQTGHRLNLSE